MIKHIKTFIAIVMSTVLLYTSTVWAYEIMSKEVVVEDYNLSLAYKTNRTVVKDFLKDENVVIGEFDKINVSLDAPIEQGMKIQIKRSLLVKIKYNDVVTELRTCSKTVAELLKEQNIQLGENDFINVDSSKELENEMVLEIKTYQEKYREETEVIPYTTRIVKTDSLSEGQTNVAQEGQNGEKVIKLKVIYLAGKEGITETVSEKVTKEPVEKIIEEGTMSTVTANDGKTYKYKRALTMSATAYTDSLQDTGKTPGMPGYGVTASGLKTKIGIVAVDTRVIPLMTKLYVEGYGPAIAADTGSAIKGNKIDLYVNSREDAMKFGRRTRQVYVLAE